jgi:glucose-1-phosphatase
LEPVKFYLTDVGNVLLRLKDEDFFSRIIAASPTLTREDLLRELKTPEGPYERYEKGRITGTDFHGYLCETYGLRWDYIDFVRNWNDFFLPNPPMDQMLSALDPALPVWALSNTNPEHCAHFCSHFPVFGLLQGVIGSHQLGCRKPGEAIYLEALRIIGAKPAEVFYVDDAPENVATAKKLGLRAYEYHFDDAALARDLAECGIRVPALKGGKHGA